MQNTVCIFCVALSTVFEKSHGAVTGPTSSPPAARSAGQVGFRCRALLLVIVLCSGLGSVLGLQNPQSKELLRAFAWPQGNSQNPQWRLNYLYVFMLQVLTAMAYQQVPVPQPSTCLGTCSSHECSSSTSSSR